MFLRRLRALSHLPKPPSQLQSRPFHNAIVKFTTTDSKGKTTSRDTDAMIGDPDESYVYIRPEVGNAIRDALGVAERAESLALEFHHESKHFSHSSLPSHRIEISQDLGRDKSKVSPATLWLSGNLYAITLDGTDDASFERMSRESARNLRGALELLKDS